MPIITIKPPNDPSQRFEVSPNRETVSLGRSSKSDVKISCESVSGTHATIRKLKEGYVLRDLGSTNGTKLDGKKVSEIHLESGQNIKLGDVIFTFEPDPGSSKKRDDSKEELPPMEDKKERAESKSKPKAKPETDEDFEPDTEKDPVVWGLSLMGSGLIIVGCIVLIGMEAIRAIPERGDNFIIGGISLIVGGLLCLGSILFVTGRIKMPKLVLEFGEDDDEEEQKPAKKTKKRKKQKKEKRDEDAKSKKGSDDKEDSEDDDAEDDEDDVELGKGPKSEDEDKSKKD